MEIKKGEIYKVWFKPRKGSHLQAGIRPAIVTSSDKKNKGNIINVTPLTKVSKRGDLGTHIIVDGYGLAQKSIALIEQTVPVDRGIILEENYIGTIDDDELLKEITYANQDQFA